jgi:hypothetical protein
MRRRRGLSRSHILLKLLSRRGIGAVMALAFLGASISYGVARGGHYEASSRNMARRRMLLRAA